MYKILREYQAELLPVVERFMETGNLTEFKAFAKGKGLMLPSNDRVLRAALFKSACMLPGVTEKYRDEAKAILIAMGMEVPELKKKTKYEFRWR